MKQSNLWSSRPSQLLTVLLTLQQVALGQSQDVPQTPSDLIRFLTYQSGRPLNAAAKGLFFSCGAALTEYKADRPVAEALVNMGPRAVPDIETALNSIETQGGDSAFAVNSDWLLDVYARILGSAAFPRLRAMLSNPQLAYLRAGVAHAIALSLGITSYVPDSAEPGEIAPCSGVVEPQLRLDQLILAWERDDRQWVEANLGPTSIEALHRLLTGTSWQAVRAKIWKANLSRSVAVGYRFVTPGWWSSVADEPFVAGTLERNPADPEIECIFTDSAGRACGTYRVKFLQTKNHYTNYLVNSADVAGLLGVISSCAVSP
jgi:hypothetical protein